MFRYAQLDDVGRVVGLSNLSGVVDHPSMIRLDEGQEVDLGDIYDKDSKSFRKPKPEELPKVEPETKELTLEDLYKGQLDVMQALTDMYLMGSGAMDMDIPDMPTDGGGN